MRPMRQLSGSSLNEQWQQQKTFSFEHLGRSVMCAAWVAAIAGRCKLQSTQSVRKSWQRLTAFSIWAANRTDIIIVLRYPVSRKGTAADSDRRHIEEERRESKRGWEKEKYTERRTDKEKSNLLLYFLIHSSFQQCYLYTFQGILCLCTPCLGILTLFAFANRPTDIMPPYSQRIRQSLRGLAPSRSWG